MLRNSNSYLKVLGLLCLIYFSFFYGIAVYPLADNNEGLYTEVAKEMYLNHHWIIPTLNKVYYLDKPPLLYWLIKINFHLFGMSELAARSVPAVSATLLCLLLILIHKIIKQDAIGWSATIILASNLGFAVMARIVFFDMLLTLWFSGCLLFYFCWWYTDKRLYLRIAYLTLGLAILAKGFLGLILIATIIFCFLLYNKNFYVDLKKSYDSLGFIILFSIIVPWHIAVGLQDPHFFWNYFINEHILRFFNQREPHDYYTGPWYYYLPRLFIYLLPWSFLTPCLFFKKKINQDLASYKAYLWIWFTVCLAFFSASQAKANYYMILGVPPLAILLAIHWKNYQNWLWLPSFLILPISISLIYLARENQAFYTEKNFIAKIHGLPLYLYQDYENLSSLAYYSQQPLKIVDSRSSDLAYGRAQARNSNYFIGLNEFKKQCYKCYIVTMKKKADLLRKKLNGAKLVEIAASNKAFLFYYQKT